MTPISSYSMRNYVTELLGSFFLMLALGLSGNPLAIGLIMVALLYTGRHLSGAHYNPAVTLAFWAAGSIPIKQAGLYILFQGLGFLAGQFLIYSLSGGVLQPVVGSSFTPLSYPVLELLLAGLFCAVYLALYLNQNMKTMQLYGVIIALSYSGILMIGQPVTGGVFNPAAAAIYTLLDHILYNEMEIRMLSYTVAPALGGVIAGNLFNWFSGSARSGTK